MATEWFEQTIPSSPSKFLGKAFSPCAAPALCPAGWQHSSLQGWAMGHRPRAAVPDGHRAAECSPSAGPPQPHPRHGLRAPRIRAPSTAWGSSQNEAALLQPQSSLKLFLPQVLSPHSLSDCSRGEWWQCHLLGHEHYGTTEDSKEK